MANQKSKFKAAVVKAKRLYKTGRYAKFSDAVKAAYGKTKTKKRKAIGAIRRKKKTASKRKIVVKSFATIGAAKSMINGSLKERLKNVLYKKEMATRKTDRRKYAKEASAVKKDIKRFS